jgi:hypothetical protein
LRLGPLGSILVAEVILAAMTRDQVTGEDGAGDLAEALQALSKKVYPDDDGHLSDLKSINSMADLIGFIERNRHLESEVPRFI